MNKPANKLKVACMAQVGICAIAILAVVCLPSSPSLAVHEGSTLPVYEVEFIDAFTVELTHNPDKIAAETTWTGISNDLQRSMVTVHVIPPGVQEKVIYKIVVAVKKVSSGEGYGSGQGTLTQDTVDFAKWTYTPFTELKTAKHPAGGRKVDVAAKYKGLECATDSLTVLSVFTYLAIDAISPYEDREKGWRYAKWKYNIYTPPMTAIWYDPGLPVRGLTTVTMGGLRYVRLGPDAFISENVCASTLGHENVHLNQDAKYLEDSARSWSEGGPDFAEVDAYNWEINHAAENGLRDYELSDVIAWRNYYNRQGPKPE